MRISKYQSAVYSGIHVLFREQKKNANWGYFIVRSKAISYNASNALNQLRR